jgi:hypothetical protein
LLKRRDVERFVELIPHWDEFSTDLRWIVLAADTGCMGFYRSGELAVCAWDAALWHEDSCPRWLRQHRDVLDRLGVVVRNRGPRLVAEWTEEQARAFQLLHIFLHELGHHVDRMTTRSRQRPARGEPFAESFAGGVANLVWDDYVRVFPL